MILQEKKIRICEQVDFDSPKMDIQNPLVGKSAAAKMWGRNKKQLVLQWWSTAH